MTSLRWKPADDGEPALFGVDELTTPVHGTGRMSDLEFLPVTAKRILNRVPSGSRAPTNWTINVYRGCSHACSYCLGGETPILMADRSLRPIADLRRGDEVVGTKNGQPVVTAVLDHWSTTERAHRVRITDGRNLVASGHHHLLTPDGWRHVGELGRGNRLVGLGDEMQTCRDSTARLHPVVAGVDDLGAAMPMYDITTGTGDFIANGVISHNCFARPTHEYLGLNIGEDFDRKIVVKINAVERVRAELADPRWAGEAVAMGTNTDPYQRAEAKFRLTRGVVEALAERNNPFSILTKSPLVTRDLDVIADAARRTKVNVHFSVGTLDERVWHATEPGSPNPHRRIEAMRRFAEAGVPTGALVAPILPALSDSAEQLRDVVAAVRDAGGRVLGLGPLYLRPGTREHFLQWLAAYDPTLHADYLRRYATSDYAPKRYLAELYRRAGISRSRDR